jgi:exodeoxyribonuclease VII small subunit
VSFEADVARLEAIAAELDGGGTGVSLDRALELFEEGVSCLRRASAELARAEARVTQLVEQVDGTFTLKPFRNE